MITDDALDSARQLLNTSPVAAIITDKTFTPIWYNNAYENKFVQFKDIEELLTSLFTIDSGDATLFKFQKVFIPIDAKYNSTGENFYLTKFPIFKGNRFIVSLVAPSQWMDTYSYSDEFFKEAFLMTPNPIVLFAFSTGEIKYLNSAFSKICSMPPEHITNMTLEDLFPSARSTIHEYLARPEPYTKPFILNAIQVDDRDIVLEISPFVFTENGNIMVVFNVQDITKHISNHVDIISYETEEYNFFIKGLTDGVIVTKDKKIIKTNNRVCKLWGYEESELLGSHSSILFKEINPTSDNPALTTFTAIRKDGSVFQGEKLSKLFFIEDSQVLVNILISEGGSNNYAENGNHDLSSQAKHSFARTILDHQPNLIIVYNKNGNMISCNKATNNFFGCASFEDFEKKYRNIEHFFIHKEGPFISPTSGPDWYKKVIDNQSREYKVALKPNEADYEQIFIVKAGEVKDEDAFIVVSFSDITDTVQTTLAVKDVNIILADKTNNVMDELQHKEAMFIRQQRLAFFGEMLGVITHQWKQPLNAISLIAQNIEEISQGCGACQASGEIKEMTATILEQIVFMSETSENFKNFLRNEIEEKVFSVNDAIDSVIKILGKIFKSKNVIIDHQYEATCANVTIRGYKNDFCQVIMNSVANAKDSILVKMKTAKTRFQGKISIKVSKYDQNTVDILISDNGVGIAEDVLPHIFERYFTTKEECGTGIGMYISKIIVDKLDGLIQCGNMQESGAYVLLRLPLSAKK